MDPEHRHQLTVGPVQRAVRLRDRALLERARAARALARRERAVPRRARSRHQGGEPVDAAARDRGRASQRRRHQQRRLPDHRSHRRQGLARRARAGRRASFDAAVSYYDGDGSRCRSPAPTSRPTDAVRRDAQLYYELPTLGGGSLKGEFYRGAQRQRRLGDRAHRVAPSRRGCCAPGGRSRPPRHRLRRRLRDVGAEPRRAVPVRRPLRALRSRTSTSTTTSTSASSVGRATASTTATRGSPSPTTSRAPRSPARRRLRRDPKDNLWTVQFQLKF